MRGCCGMSGKFGMCATVCMVAGLVICVLVILHMVGVI